MPTLRRLSADSFRAMPWKNGGGCTRELAVWPDNASLADFVWRASIADVAGGGPFSTFAGVDRTLVLLSGAGLQLDAPGLAVTLGAPYEACSFAGELSIDATLADGPVRDFNLMWRRERAEGAVAVVRDGARLAARASFRLCYAASGAYRCTSGDAAPIEIAAGQVLVIEQVAAADDGLELQPLCPGSVALVASVALR